MALALLLGAACSPRPPDSDALPVAIGGTVTGLAGSGLVLQNNQGDNLSIASNGNFRFSRPLPVGSEYAVTVLAQPKVPDQICHVSSASGVTRPTGVADVAVTCDAPRCTVTSFSAEAATVEAGTASTLTWTTINCDAWKIEPDVHTVYGYGNDRVSVTPAHTTTYTLTATGPTGTSSAKATVTVTPVIDAFEASPATIPAGAATSLWWNVRGATAISIDQGVGAVATTSLGVSPATSTTYTLTATGGGAGGTATRQLQVNVVPADGIVLHDAVVAPGGAVTLRPVETSAMKGSPIVLDWSVPASSGAAVSPAQGPTTVFTAPMTPGAYRVEAASTTDPSRKGSCTVTVTAPGTWTTLPSLPTPRHAGVAVAMDGKLWVVGGRSSSATTGELDQGAVEVFDAGTSTWRVRAPLNLPRSNHQAAAVGGKIYVFGGSYGVAGGAGYTDTVEEYDPSTDTWRYRAAMPTRRAYGSALTIGGHVYLVGGWDARRGELATTVDVYDAATDTWAPAGAGGTVAVPAFTQGADSIDGVVYVVSGYEPSLLAYTPGLPGRTVARASIPARRSMDEGVVAAKGRLYAVGGARADRRVTEYDPIGDAWNVRESMRMLRGSAQTAQVGDLVYVVGGSVAAGQTVAPAAGPSTGAAEVYTPP